MLWPEGNERTGSDKKEPRRAGWWGVGGGGPPMGWFPGKAGSMRGVSGILVPKAHHSATQ